MDSVDTACDFWAKTSLLWMHIIQCFTIES